MHNCTVYREAAIGIIMQGYICAKITLFAVWVILLYLALKLLM